MKSEKWRIILLVILLLALFTPPSLAQSSYTLPYPSFMPGSKLYVAHQVWEKIMQYWYFGNFAQFTYNLKTSDKYLVEAKTLFEYRQYLLAYQALKKSDVFFIETKKKLAQAQKENKNIVQKSNLLREASIKHREILQELKRNVPESLTWRPEKSPPTELNLGKTIEESIKKRGGNL